MTLFQRWILLGFPDPVSEVEATGTLPTGPFHVASNADSRSWWAWLGPQYLKRSMKCCGDTGVKQLPCRGGPSPRVIKQGSSPSRRGCCSAGRSAGCLHTAPWWGSASEVQNTSASTPHGLFLKGSSVYKTRQTDFCSDADDFHSNVICTTTLKGNTLQETFNYVKLNLS